MRQSSRYSVGWAVLPVLALALATAPSLGGNALPADQGDSWSVVAATGQVESAAASNQHLLWQMVSRGQSLAPMTQVKTGQDSRATLTDGKNIMIVDPDTHIELPAPASRRAPTRVYQHAGVAHYQVNDARKRRFQVITPFLVAGVKGTKFKVSVTDADAGVQVTEGVVNVVSPLDGREMDLFAGEEARIDALQDATSVSFAARDSATGELIQRAVTVDGDEATKTEIPDLLDRKEQFLQAHDSRPDADSGVTDQGHGKPDVSTSTEGLAEEVIKEVPRGLTSLPPAQGGVPPGNGGVPPGTGELPPGQGNKP